MCVLNTLKPRSTSSFCDYFGGYIQNSHPLKDQLCINTHWNKKNATFIQAHSKKKKIIENETKRNEASDNGTRRKDVSIESIIK